MVAEKIAPVAVSHRAFQNDIRLILKAQPGDPIGFVDVELGLGKGSKGKGNRPGNDTLTFIEALKTMSQHLVAYINDFESAARADGTI